MIDQPLSTSLQASQSRSAGWLGFCPMAPKSSIDRTIPSPKWCCQRRLTSTRGTSGLTAGSTIRRASSLRPLPPSDGLAIRAAQDRQEPPGDDVAEALVTAADMDVLVHPGSLGLCRGERRGRDSHLERNCSGNGCRQTVGQDGPSRPQRGDCLGEVELRSLVLRAGARCGVFRCGVVGRPDLIDGDPAVAVVNVRCRPAKVDNRTIGDFEVGGMPQPHFDVERHPSRRRADVHHRRQSAVDRRANLLEPVDHHADPAPAAGGQKVNVARFDRERARAQDSLQPL